jgi:hypothetical protein
VHDELAVELAPIAPWATVDPAAGVLPAGAAVELAVSMSARDLETGRYTADLRLHSNDPAAPERLIPLTLAVETVELTRFEVRPRTINTGARGQSIRATLQLPSGYDPRRVRIDTVRLGDRVAAEPHPVELGDDDGDGIEELTLRFDRRAVIELLQDVGDRLTITGEVAGQAWFHGATTVETVERGRAR